MSQSSLVARLTVGRLLALAAATCVMLVLGAAPASAAFTAPHPFVSSFDGSGSTAGAFSDVRGVAVSRSSGNVFVYDGATSSLSQFDTSGTPVAFSDPGLFGASSITLGFPDARGSVAVDNSGTASDGNVYVATGCCFGGGSQVWGIDASGAALPGFPKPVDSFYGVCSVAVDSAGHFWLGIPFDGLREYDSQGNALGGFLPRDGDSMCPGVAFDASGSVYVNGGGAVSKHNADGSGGFVADPDRPILHEGRSSGVAVDPVSGHVFVSHPSDAATPGISEYDSDGALVSEWGSDVVANAVGVAVNPVNGRVYVAEPGVVHVFSSTFVLDVAVAEPTAVSPTGATLHGTVDPVGEQVTDCRFEFGPTSAYGQSVPCDQSPAQIGAGNGPVAVSADLSGLTPGVTYHYRLSASNADLTSLSADTLLGAPQVKRPSAEPVAKTTATLRAQVNPGGVATSCEFHYVAEADYDASLADPYGAGQTAPCSTGLGSASTDVPTTADVTGLQPGTTYHARVVATNARGSTSSSDGKFSTLPAARISGLSITDVEPTSATISARINPLGDETTYYFEYGTTTAYGNRAPVPAQSIGSGSDDVPVSMQLTGLTPGTTYHVRLVAENAAGIARSADRRFGHSTGGAGLPDNRAYEQVTPVDKSGAAYDVTVFTPFPEVAESGNRVMFSSIQCFPGSTACPANNRLVQGALYNSERSSSGWQTTQVTPPVSEYDGSSTKRPLADTGAALFAVSRLGSEANPRTDLLVRRVDGSSALIGPVQGPEAVGGAAFPETVQIADDLSRTVFQDDSDTLGWPFDDTFRSGGMQSIHHSVLEYAGTDNSQPFLVAVTGGRGSTDLIGDCGVGFGADRGGIGALSRDGRVVYVTVHGVPGGECGPGTSAPVTEELYARIDESRTVKISERSPAGCTTQSCLTSAPKDALFQTASEDGSKVLFMSEQQLTDDATQDRSNLYLYDFDQPAGEELTAISARDTTGDGPQVQGVLTVSNDGSHVYFVAKGVLESARDPFGRTPDVGANNLYLYEHGAEGVGRRAFIGQLADNDRPYWSDLLRPANVTRSGRYLVFPSRGDVTPQGGSSNHAAQIYRYDAQAHELLRISVGEGGFNNDGDGSGSPPCVFVFPGSCSVDSSTLTPTVKSWRRDPSMSRDGEYVFFTSPAALTPGATDYAPTGAFILDTAVPHYHHNVYQWHDGHVSLIADGRGSLRAGPIGDGTPRSVLVGVDASGRNVFFKSHAALSPSDTDNGQLDIYSARVCADGDPCVQAPVTATACAGDACQGAASGVPAAPVAATVDLVGSGNAKRPLRVRASVLTRAVRGRSFLVRVRVPGRGRIAITGRAIKRARRSAAKAGSYPVRVSLTKAAARRSLKRKLRIRIGVRYVAGTGAASTTKVTLTVAKRSRRHAATSGGGAR